ncbi:MAG: hypothetical protein HFI74_10135 [Lachnospiraceae bacterium]|jgi:hypothetical protein|nr:hypothetical protein [Lachnospiraceae bacterium]
MKTGKRVCAIFLAVVMMVLMLPIQGKAAALDQTKAVVYVGSKITLKLKGSSGKISWNSSDKSVAVVDNKGRVTARKPGKSVITAKYKKKSYQCRVTVKKPYLNSTKKTLKKGKTYTLKLTGTKAVSWHSSKKSVASVSGNGKVTAKKSGNAVITCKGKDGKSYRCKITVKEQANSGLTDQKVYQAMIAMKSKYPEGMKWTNANYYQWNGGIYSGGYGCAGFAFALSDAAFGDLPARSHKDFSKIKVGDIVRMNYDSHSVIVLKVQSDGVVVAEGNFNNSVHWGREISNQEIKASGTYVLTRYPK